MHPLIPYFDQPVLTIPLPKGLLPFDAIPLHAFGLLVALGFLLGSRLAMNRAARLGLDPEAINKLVGWLVVGTFIGGHVGNELMYAPRETLADPARLLRVWDGLSSFGGFIVCVPLTWYFFKKEKLPFWPYADCVAINLAFGWFLGRMGCFVAHDHPGSITNFWLGVYGICPAGQRDVACHDMGLYEALWALGMFGILSLLDRKARVPGFYPAMLGLLYGPVRFFMDFLRPESTDAKYAGLTPAQYCAALFTVGCAFLLFRRLQSGEAPVWAPPGTQPPAAATPPR